MKELSKYEYARIIGARSLQLSLGAPPLVKLKEKKFDPVTIAKEEFENDLIPLSVLKN